MIEALRLRNFGIVDQLMLPFDHGLNVITGETGAGKSLILSSLQWLAGERAQADQIREGADEASVEAIFQLDELNDLEKQLREHDFETDSGELLVRRSLVRAGKSRAEVGGRWTTLRQLAALFDGRIEISSQHASQALRDPEVQSHLLDEYAGLHDQRHAVALAYDDLQKTLAQAAALNGSASQRANRMLEIEQEMKKLEAAKFVPGEREQIEAELARLQHAERLQAGVAACLQLLEGEASELHAMGISEALGKLIRELEGLARFDPSLEEVVAGFHVLQDELGARGQFLLNYTENLDANPNRLQELQSRSVLLDELARRYGDEADAPAVALAKLSEEQEALSAAETQAENILEQVAIRQQSLKRAAKQLSKSRMQAARLLSNAFGEALGRLDLPKARLEVVLEPRSLNDHFPSTRDGIERAAFAWSANPGESLRPLRRVASGGELSRVFLAIKNVLRRSASGMVLVFDEIDTGVGGATAARIGELLEELARDHQVLCITHLPQVAARADQHLRVWKRSQRGRTQIAAEVLTADQRVEEIARMAGGSKITATTRRHARELLGKRLTFA